MPIENIAEFIIYVSPGFIALKIYTEVYKQKKREQFDFIAWCIIIGLILVNLVKWIDSSYLSNSLGSEKSGFPCFRFTITLIGSGVLLGFLLILFVYLRRCIYKKWKILKFLEFHHDTIWQEINDTNQQVWAVVFLDNDVIYLGWIKGYTFEPESKDYEFLLTHAKKVDKDLNVEYEVKGIGVYLQLSNVNRIELLTGIEYETT